MSRKVIRNISIDIEIDDKLKIKDNASGFINEMLISHFKAPENMTPEQRNKRIAELTIQLEANRKIKELNNE